MGPDSNEHEDGRNNDQNESEELPFSLGQIHVASMLTLYQIIK